MEQLILLSPKNEKIVGDYLEIGRICVDLCQSYCNNSLQCKKEFLIFSREYTFFQPYFDFVLSKLGYIMINPLLEQDVVWYYDHGKIVRKKIANVLDYSYMQIRNFKNTIYYYPMLDRTSVNIHPIDYNKPINSIIDSNGNQIEVDITEENHHDDLFERILNQLLLVSPELLDDYKKQFVYFQTVNGYFRNRLGYVQVAVNDEQHGTILYNPHFELATVQKYVNNISEKFPYYQIVQDFMDNSRIK